MKNKLNLGPFYIKNEEFKKILQEWASKIPNNYIADLAKKFMSILIIPKQEKGLPLPMR